MAVAKNDSGTPNKAVSGATSASLTTFAVSAGSNLFLLACLGTSSNVSATTITWDSGGTNQAMTSSINTLSGGTIRQQLFILINPKVGTLTLKAAWTTASDANLTAIAFSGADQSTGIQSADNVTNNSGGANTSLTITSSSDGATVAFISDNQTITTNLGTQIVAYQGGPHCGGSYLLGGSSNVHSWTVSSGSDAAQGVHVLGAGGATNSLFRSNPLTGLGAGGPFFSDPLAMQGGFAYSKKSKIFIPAHVGRSKFFTRTI